MIFQKHGYASNYQGKLLNPIYKERGEKSFEAHHSVSLSVCSHAFIDF